MAGCPPIMGTAAECDQTNQDAGSHYRLCDKRGTLVTSRSCALCEYLAFLEHAYDTFDMKLGCAVRSVSTKSCRDAKL